MLSNTATASHLKCGWRNWEPDFLFHWIFINLNSCVRWMAIILDSTVLKHYRQLGNLRSNKMTNFPKVTNTLMGLLTHSQRDKSQGRKSQGKLLTPNLLFQNTSVHFSFLLVDFGQGTRNDSWYFRQVGMQFSKLIRAPPTYTHHRKANTFDSDIMTGLSEIQ